ncbi:transmembrane protein 176B-like [Rhynchocyon petersi]
MGCPAELPRQVARACTPSPHQIVCKQSLPTKSCSVASTTLTVNGVNMASTLSQPTHINIRIHQESVLGPFLKAGHSLLCFFFHLQDIVPPKSRMSQGQLALGVTQILLGLVSGALGVFFYFGPWIELRGSGCAFWAGAVAIVAGAAIIFHEKHKSYISGLVSVLLTLAGIATVLAAIVLCVNSLTWQSDGFLHIHTVCDPPARNNTTSRYSWIRQRWNDDDWKKAQCNSYMQMLMNMFLAIRALLLAVCVLQVLVSLIFLAVGLRSLCSHRSQHHDGEEPEKKLLGDKPLSPSPSSEKIPTAITCQLPGAVCVPVAPCLE